MATNVFSNDGSAATAGIVHGDMNTNTNIYNNTAQPDPIPDGINFRVVEPESNFTGRSHELDQLKEMSTSTEAKKMVVSGMGGVGKTQLVRKFIAVNRILYSNVIWIDSENEAEVNKSFKVLSKDILHLPTTDANGRDKDSESIIEQVLKKLCQRKSLFVYDNVDSTQSIQFILAMASPPIGEKPHVLITSRLQKWSPHIIVIRLPVWSPAQAIEYISVTLTDSHSHLDCDKIQLAKTLEYFPLALRQATAYINKQREMDGTSTIGSYIEKYARKTGEILNSKTFHEYTTDIYDKTTYTTWDITIDAIKANNEHGTLAIRILRIVAYLEPYWIERHYFFELKLTSDNDHQHDEREEFEDRVKRAVELLIKFSMIDSVKAQEVFSVHRLVQEVTKFKLKKSMEEAGVLEDAVEWIERLTKDEDEDGTCSYVLSDFLSIFLNASKASTFNELLARVSVSLLKDLTKFGRANEVIELADRMLGPLNGILGQNSRDILQIRLNVAKAYMKKGLNDEAMQMHLDIHSRQKAHFGEGDDDTLQTQIEIVNLYEDLGNFDAARDWYERAVEIQKKTYGEDHEDFLRYMWHLTRFYKTFRKHGEIYQLLDELCDKRKNSLLGNDVTRSDIDIEPGNYPEITETLRLYQEAVKNMVPEFKGDSWLSLKNKCKTAFEYSELRRHSDTLQMLEEVLERFTLYLHEDNSEIGGNKTEAETKIIADNTGNER